MRYRLLLGIFIATVFPVGAEAYRGEVAVWIPWWQDTMGIESAAENIRDIDTIYPFVYEIEGVSAVVDKANLEEQQWQRLFRLAERRRVEVIPTIAWFDGPAIHQALSSRVLRDDLIARIVDLVEENDFDGVNIDFEQKQSRTIDYFSRFLRDLNRALGRKVLTCAIEARTPPQDLYRVVPQLLEYANDYRAINRYCDRIELMTYDQQRADLTLNHERRGVPYAPVADADWVEKVIELALKDFDEDKTYLGVATYGRAWDITVAPEWYRDYMRVATLNEPRILELAEKYNAPIGRTAGGEAVISYFPDDSPWRVFDALPTPPGTPRGFEAAAKALLVATYANIEVPVRVVFWSDRSAITDKLDLAEEYGLAGVAIFKVDGEETPGLWRDL
jgi:spore germination protein YaaH